MYSGIQEQKEDKKGKDSFATRYPNKGKNDKKDVLQMSTYYSTLYMMTTTKRGRK
jgi:hypothetical protein